MDLKCPHILQGENVDLACSIFPFARNICLTSEPIFTEESQLTRNKISEYYRPTNTHSTLINVGNCIYESSLKGALGHNRFNCEIFWCPIRLSDRFKNWCQEMNAAHSTFIASVDCANFKMHVLAIISTNNINQHLGFYCVTNWRQITSLVRREFTPLIARVPTLEKKFVKQRIFNHLLKANSICRLHAF